MSKTTNIYQLEILLNAMQAQPQFARGFYKGDKEELRRFWENLENDLNSAGPPKKSTSDWKKVWTDKKKYVRNKVNQILNASTATGGSPNAEQLISAAEKTIYNLIAIEEFVEDVTITSGMGTSTSSKRTLETRTGVEEILLSGDSENNMLEYEYQPPPKKQKDAHKEVPPKKSTAVVDVLAEELLIQKQICRAMKKQRKNTKKIYRSIDRLCNQKKEELAELQRHNFVMEKLRIREVNDKIKRNRRLLELEDLKATLNLAKTYL